MGAVADCFRSLVSLCDLLQVVALHKDRYVFPCTLKVTRFSGTGVDAMFMGVLKVICPGQLVYIRCTVNDSVTSTKNWHRSATDTAPDMCQVDPTAMYCAY
jgi:hypothetical protein